MSRIAVVTSFSPSGYETYGREMLRLFDQYWPSDVELHVFHEDEIPQGATTRASWFNLDNDLDRKKFIATHKDHPIGGDRWFREMPVKFCHKVFAVTSAPRDADWLIWLDADIETRRPVTHEFLDTILPQSKVATYLGRRYWTHTETGFVAYNLKNGGKQFLDALRGYYVSDRIMQANALHDCAAFDYVRQVFEGQGHKFLDLGEGYRGPSIDIMAKSVLGPYLYHHKGENRKQRAYGAVA